MARSARALEERRTLLAEGDGPESNRSTREVIQCINDLLEENQRLQAAGKSYLGQLNVAFTRLREAIIIINEEDYIVGANEALMEVLSLGEDPGGRRLETVLRSSSLIEYIRKVRIGGSAEHREMEFILEPEPRWFEVTAARLERGEGGESGDILVVLHDITRQKRLERVRTEFVANVSHELRTPVTVIKGFVEALEEDHRELSVEEREGFLCKIHKNVDRLHLLLEELLLLSRLESNRPILKTEAVPLDEVVREVADGYLERAGKRNVRLEVSSEASPHVEGDVMRLSQVFENLIENAFRHAFGLSAIRIVVRQAGAMACVEVNDDGSGIPAADLAHVFERFYRVDKGRSRESGGSGLGLAIVKHIVQLHKGHVEVTSREGKGTSFRIFLPARGMDTF